MEDNERYIMSRIRPVSLDHHFIADSGDALARENPVAQGNGPDFPIVPDASLVSEYALSAGSVEMAALNGEMADSLLDIDPVADDGEVIETASAAPNGGGGGTDGWNLEFGSADFSLQATGLLDWHSLTTDEVLRAADGMPRFSSDGHDAFLLVSDFVPSAGSGQEFSSAGDLMFLDLESYARPSSPGGGGGNDKKGGGDSGVVSEYLSGPDGGYNILVDFEGSWTSLLQDAFIVSAEWISSAITGDVADVFYRGKIIDDIKITAELNEIDGSGGILGQAGPTAIRTDGYLPALGIMQFDVADATDYYDIGYWEDIVLHEMLHTVGFGTIWSFLDLVDGSGTSTPTFTGTEAILTYEQLFGGAGDVPLESGYGPGTDESHWDEALFDNELMTGFIDTNSDINTTAVGDSNYISGMTVASLADLGYSVDSNWSNDLVELIV